MINFTRNRYTNAIARNLQTHIDKYNYILYNRIVIKMAKIFSIMDILTGGAKLVVFTDLEKEEMVQKLVSNMPMLRKRLNLSQEELASIAGVSRQTINAVESGRQNMSWNLFILLILFFMHNESTRDFLPVVKFDIKKLEEYFLNK